MDSSFFLAVVATAIGFFMIFRKFRFRQENQEIDSSSSSSSPSSLSVSTVNPPTSSPHNWTYNVFPSFRGEDVRIDFLSHIQKEFGRKGITPFVDNEIKRGESIGPELKRAIRGSKMAIILLSKNYASSKWCLDELVEIMKCREEVGQTVMAIFYKVDPSDVKKLTGDFGKVFKKTCVGKSKEDIERWRQALVKVATIAGYDSRNWDNEAAMIERIATDVSSQLVNSSPSSDFDGLVGMRAHMEKMNLQLDSNEVKMIGIWGPSGIGKSTIARALYSKYSHQFQLSVFMDNIKIRYPRPCYDGYSAKLQLQKEFLSQIINHENIKIPHLGVAQDRLKHNRVLVVLDDVDQSMQLDAVAKEARWFGSGSRIIITTQDKKLLNAHGINHIYKVGFPADNEALQILCMYAFGQKSPYDGFEELALEVTKLAGKLPLGLRVMGSYLKGRTKEEWKRELPRLRTSLDGEIESILEFSYNALGAEDKELFLYIACFFNNQRIDKVKEHLAKNFSDVSQGLRILAEKSLISFNGLGEVEMHDLLERLGREIVRKQSIHDPGQRQFLVDARDICKVLNNDTHSRGSVIGAIINLSKIEDELNRSYIALERFSSLQFLRLNEKSDNKKVRLVDYLYNDSRSTWKSLKNLPRKVRLLDWLRFPMTCLPCNFNPEFLVELNMRRSNLKKLWKGNKSIRNLKWMNLSDSHNLRELPDLSTATNLQELDLCGCSSLLELPSSIGNAINLKELGLSYCSSLLELPSSIGNAINLKELNLSGCSSLLELPSSIGNAINLQRLDLSHCSSLVELPSSIGNAINLQELNLSRCSSLLELPSSIGNAINLQRLDLSDCSNLVELPSSIGNAINLWKLNLTACSSLVKLPSSIGNAINLQILDLSECSNLVELPSSIGNAINLWKLNLTACSSLVKLPSSIGNAINLWKLNLTACSSLVKLPSSIGNAINLEELNLSGCSRVVELPDSIGNVINLKELNLSGCSRVVELPSCIGNAINLKELNLSGCSRVVELPSSIGNAINLWILNLSGCSSLMELPSSIGNAINLEVLNLSGCSSLVKLPSSIGNLHKLLVLRLKGCSKLEAIPINININMECFSELDLTDCLLLKKVPKIFTETEVEENLSGSRFKLRISSWEHLGEFSHAFKYITKLYLSDKRIQEIAPCVKELSRLQTLVIKGCTKLVSLPQLPDSLEILDAQNCGSLERLDCSFQNNKLIRLNFGNCFKLNQEARDLIIIKTSGYKNAVLPGEKVPPHFSYRATGSSLSMKLSGIDTHFPTSLRFKACVLLVSKGDVEVDDWTHEVTHRIKEKQNGVDVTCSSANTNLSTRLKKHLFIFHLLSNSSGELVFEFEVYNRVFVRKKEFEIEECGIEECQKAY